MMKSTPATGHVQILIGIRNGARYLPELLDSLADQTHGDWSLLAGDDSSEDDSIAKLETFAREHPARRVEILPGPCRGSGANFLSLLLRTHPECSIAFCDQDDVWMPRKITRALASLAPAPGEPVVYASRTLLVDGALKPERLSPLLRRSPSFGNALVQNVLSGNTIMLSPAAAALLRESAPAALAEGVPFHDWWTYQVATGSGMRIVHDPVPTLLYRQHAANLLGASRGVQAGLARMGRVWTRDYSGWIDANLAALFQLAPLLADDARRIMDGFAAARRGPRRELPGAMTRLGVHRQGAVGDRALRIFAQLGRL